MAGVILLVLGVLGGLLGLVLVLGGAVVGNAGRNGGIPGLEGMPNVAGAFGGLVAVIGLVVVLYSLLYIFGGIGVLRSREWGRVIGIVVSILSGLVWLAALVSPSDPSTGSGGGGPVAAALLIAHAYVVVVLAIRWRAV